MDAELLRASLAEVEARARDGASDGDLHAMRYAVGHILDQNPQQQDQKLGLVSRGFSLLV